MKKLSVILIILFPILCLSQNEDLDSLMSRINVLAEERRANYWNEKRDSIFEEFELTFLNTIKHPYFCNGKIPEGHDIQNSGYQKEDRGVSLVYGMMNSINQCSSPDQKVTIFSWDDLGGGSYHSYTNYSLVSTDSLGCKIDRFDELTQEQIDSHEYGIEVGYYDIQQVSDTVADYYILFGFGTYGGGKQHQAVRVYQIIDNKLKESMSSYPNNEPLVFFCNRGQELGVEFENGVLNYNQYEYEDNSGFYGTSYKTIRLKFEEGKFVQIE